MRGEVQVRNELRSLTSARGIAAWYVVLYHIRESAAGAIPPAGMAFLAKGYLAVDFFFILSGFVIWLNYRELIEDQRWRAVPHFLWRRLARIYPLHLLMLGLAIGFALVCAVTGRPLSADYSWATLPYHLLLMQNWGLLDRLGWNVPAWSISCEFAAYLLFPLLALACDWRRLSSLSLAALLALLPLALFGLFTLAGKDLLGNDIPHLGLPRCLLEFAMGTILAALWLRWREAPGGTAMVAAASGLAALLAYLAGAPEVLSVPVLFAALVMLLALRADGTGFLAARTIHWMGEISYAVYLSHALLFMIFKIAFVRDPANVPLPLLGAFLLLVLLVSSLLYHGFELPAQRWLNRRGPVRPAGRASIGD